MLVVEATYVLLVSRVGMRHRINPGNYRSLSFSGFLLPDIDIGSEIPE